MGNKTTRKFISDSKIGTTSGETNIDDSFDGSQNNKGKVTEYILGDNDEKIDITLIDDVILSFIECGVDDECFIHITYEKKEQVINTCWCEEILDKDFHKKYNGELMRNFTVTYHIINRKTKIVCKVAHDIVSHSDCMRDRVKYLNSHMISRSNIYNSFYMIPSMVYDVVIMNGQVTKYKIMSLNPDAPPLEEGVFEETSNKNKSDNNYIEVRSACTQAEYKACSENVEYDVVYNKAIGVVSLSEKLKPRHINLPLD